MRRRAVLVPLGTLALIVSGVVGAEFVGETIRDTPPVPEAVQVSGVSLPPNAGVSIQEKSRTTVPRQRAAVALCRAQPDAVRDLTKIAKNAPALENLRDGLPQLEEKLNEVQLAAEGRPALNPVVTRLTNIRNLWRAALEASDRGLAKEADAAMAEADLQLGKLSGDIDKAYPGHGKDCTPAKK